MQHKPFAIFPLQGVDDLFIAGGAQRGDSQGLSLTTREQCRTVRSGKYACPDRYWAHGARIAAVDARFAVQNLAADDLGFNIAENRLDQIDVSRVRSFRCD